MLSDSICKQYLSTVLTCHGAPPCPCPTLGPQPSDTIDSCVTTSSSLPSIKVHRAVFDSRDLTPYSSSLPTLAYIWPALAPDLGLYQDLERKGGRQLRPQPFHPSGGVGGNLPAGPAAPALSWGRPPSRWPYLHVFILLLQAFISQKLVDGFGFPSCKGEAVRERQHCQELGTLR